MKKLLLIAIAGGLMFTSCSKKAPDFANSIPDKAFAVVSMHPMDLHTKGKVNTLEYLKEKVKDEFFGQVLEDPLSTGLMLDAYVYIFARMEEEAPVIGVVSGIKDVEKFQTTLQRIREDILEDAKEADIYKFVQPDKEGIIAWNEKQMVLLASPDYDEFDEAYWKENLDWMFNPVKEESVISLVDFKDFHDKMKDLNMWFSTDDIMKVVKKFSKEKLGDLPVNLPNNYTHMYIDFANGEMNIIGETNFSEEVEKNLNEVLVMKPSLNQDILKMTPGGNLLLAMAVSMDLEKVKNLVEKYMPSEMGDTTLSKKVEQAIGIPPEQLLKAFNGDFTLAINGIENEAVLPVEFFIGFGVVSDEIQKQMMGKMEEMMPVEKEGDFFVINIQGTEIVSGIYNDTWVITNAKGYRDAVQNGGLDKTLLDTRFKDFAGGSMGMYVNLDLASYPEMVSGLLEQKGKMDWVKNITDPFDYLGITAGDRKSLMTLKTNRPDENSLYTILKMPDSHQ
jgi:hypothetical protein